MEEKNEKIQEQVVSEEGNVSNSQVVDKKKKNQLMVGIVAGVVLLCVLSFGGWYILSQNTK